tara:strand:- start:1009 stop:1179 length:171 start_codon:yes stop_codon:yes gene_type:complete
LVLASSAFEVPKKAKPSSKRKKKRKKAPAAISFPGNGFLGVTVEGASVLDVRTCAA